MKDNKSWTTEQDGINKQKFTHFKKTLTSPLSLPKKIIKGEEEKGFFVLVDILNRVSVLIATSLLHYQLKQYFNILQLIAISSIIAYLNNTLYICV